MSSSNPLDEANNLIVRRMILQYLPPNGEAIRTVEGACVVTTQIANRYGVPPDTVTVRHEVWHPDEGFAFDVRSASRCDNLLNPIAVHTVIEDYTNKGNHANDYAVRIAANTWLRSLPL